MSTKHVGLSPLTKKLLDSVKITLLGVVASLASIIPSNSTTFDTKSMSGVIIVTLLFVFCAVIFTFVLANRERGPSRIVKLKDNLANAYLDALDKSSLNPLR